MLAGFGILCIAAAGFALGAVLGSNTRVSLVELVAVLLLALAGGLLARP